MRVRAGRYEGGWALQEALRIHHNADPDAPIEELMGTITLIIASTFRSVD